MHTEPIRTSHRILAAKLGRDQRWVRQLVERLVESGALTREHATPSAAPRAPGEPGRPATEYLLTDDAALVVLARCRGASPLVIRRELDRRALRPLTCAPLG